MEAWEEIAWGAMILIIAWLFIRQEKQGNTITSMIVKLDNIIEAQKEFDAKLNLFLKSEVDTLKELVRQGKGRSQQNTD